MLSSLSLQWECLGQSCTNLIEFYIFFEVMLIPGFFLIAFWGDGERRKISLMFLFWTHVGAVVLLLGFLASWHSELACTSCHLLRLRDARAVYRRFNIHSMYAIVSAVATMPSPNVTMRRVEPSFMAVSSAP